MGLALEITGERKKIVYKSTVVQGLFIQEIQIEMIKLQN